jgi:putative NADH-flavin reductase
MRQRKNLANRWSSQLARRIAYLAAVLTVVIFAPLTHAVDAKDSKLVIIGATAATCESLIPLALERGYEVIGIARRPEAVTLRHDRLTILKGDVYDRASIEAALSGTETVIGVFGPRVDMAQPIPEMDLFSTGYTNVIAAMRTKGNTRLLATSSIGAQKAFTTKPLPDAPRADHWLWQIRGIYTDMRLMESIVRRSGLDFTILRPGQLMPEPARNDLKIAIDESAPELTLITYADFARFILDTATSEAYSGNTVGLYSDRQLQYGVNFSTDD